MKKCRIRNCQQPSRSLGLCPKHLQRFYRHGKATTVLRKQNITHKYGGEGCSVKDCNGKFNCHGFCYKHYVRWKRHGDPLYNHHDKTIAFIEKAIAYRGSECLLWPFKTKAGAGYGIFSLNGKRQYVHSFVCKRVHGPPPSPKHVASHKCGNGHQGCITPKHLRWQTRSEDRADMKRHGTGSNQFGKFASFPKQCTVQGCDRSSYAKGLCNMHWQRERKTIYEALPRHASEMLAS